MQGYRRIPIDNHLAFLLFLAGCSIDTRSILSQLYLGLAGSSFLIWLVTFISFSLKIEKESSI
jgi:hypothetical protein